MAQELARLNRENEELRRRVEELSRYVTLAYRDPLTDLRNRRYFDERVSEETAHAERDPRYCFSLLVVDLDHFKRINDHHGHAVGDHVLCWIAQWFESHLRAHDVCCRLAGDEFVVILPGTDHDECQALAERLAHQLHDEVQPLPEPLSFSIGGATYGIHGTRPAELFAHADDLMYQHKRARRDARRQTMQAQAGLLLGQLVASQLDRQL